MSKGENQAETSNAPSQARLLLRFLTFVSILAAILFLSAGRLVQFCPKAELPGVALARHT